MRLNVSIAAAALAALSRTAAVNASKSSIPQDCAITSLTVGFAVSAVKPSFAISRRIPRRVRHSRAASVSRSPASSGIDPPSLAVSKTAAAVGAGSSEESPARVS